MAERYQRLFSFSEKDLYAAGAPVLIANGALLLDTVTNSVLAQLKLQNIGAKTIKAVKVAVTPRDSVNRPLGEPVPYEYLDLQAARDDAFGSDRPIQVPDAATRAFSAAVTEVAFADNTIWSADADAVWESVPEAEPLEKTLGDDELAKQFAIRFGESAKYQPMRHADLWRCACGVLNRADEKACYKCGRSAETLFGCDLQELTKEKDARLVEEQAAREAKAAAEHKAAEEKKAAAEAAAKKLKKILKIAIPTLAAVLAAVLVITKVVIPNGKYNDAVALMESGDYDAAVAAFEAMDGYKDSNAKIEEIKNIKAQAALEQGISRAEQLEKEGKLAEAAMTYGALIEQVPSCREKSVSLWEIVAPRKTIASGAGHTVGLKADGTVVAVGCNDDGECDVVGWTNIVSVAAGYSHTVGLKVDGTVVAVGCNNHGECNVIGWTDIVAIAASAYHTVGLKSDGSVVIAGESPLGSYDVSGWSHIVAIAADGSRTIGLTSSGKVTIADYCEQKYDSDVSCWTDIVAIAVDSPRVAGLKSNGTVASLGGFNNYGECDVSDWTDIVAVSAGSGHTVGLKADGTVIAKGNNEYGQCDVSGWKDIVAIDARHYNTVGLRADGTVVAVGNNEHGECDVSDWTDIRLPSAK